MSDLMTTTEVAAYVRIKKATLERYRLTGGGPHYCRLGGMIRYRKKDIEAWLESRTVKSTKEAKVKCP